MLAEQSRSVASGLVGQIPDMAKVALMFKRPVTKRFDITDIVTMVDPRNSSPTRPSVSAGGGGRSKSQGKQPVTAQLMALGYQANNRMMFAQPMVQSYYQERWRHGDDTTHVDQKPAAVRESETFVVRRSLPGRFVVYVLRFRDPRVTLVPLPRSCLATKPSAG